jgi:prevent-host-death family protein
MATVVAATEFKARCLELMDRVAEGRSTYVITKHGRPVAKLVPAGPPNEKDLFGCLADRTVFVGDIEKPLWTEEEWKAFNDWRTQQWKAGARRSRKVGVAPGGGRLHGHPDSPRARAARGRSQPR